MYTLDNDDNDLPIQYVYEVSQFGKHKPVLHGFGQASRFQIRNIDQFEQPS